MDNREPEVKYYNSNSGTVSSTTGLFPNESNKKMKTRVLYGCVAVLLAVVVALAIALAVVANDKQQDGGDDQRSTSSEQTGADNSYWPVPDCSYAVTNVEKANCVLDSYPLVDG